MLAAGRVRWGFENNQLFLGYQREVSPAGIWLPADCGEAAEGFFKIMSVFCVISVKYPLRE